MIEREKKVVRFLEINLADKNKVISFASAFEKDD
jgi:hypothetical protein